MTDLLKDFITFFQSKGAVQGDGIDAFRDTAPDTPDSIVVLYEYAGDPAPIQDESVHRSVQVVVRDKSATVAKEKARSLYKLVDSADKVVKLTEERWCMIYPRQVPFKIKVDNTGKVYYGFNLGVTTYKD